MKRLTNRRTAEQVRQNCEGLIKAGVQPSILDLMYCRLADYENAEEDRERLFVSYDPDEEYYE